MSARDTVDLTNCDVEPIHIPGSIQPHGCLFGLRYVGRNDHPSRCKLCGNAWG